MLLKMQDQQIPVLRTGQPIFAERLPDTFLWHGDVERSLDHCALSAALKKIRIFQDV
jgi:hypothetical protein